METASQQTPATADLQQRELDAMCVNESVLKHPWWYNLKYSAWGILFGIESFHMYGVIGTAVMVGLISVLLIKRTKARTIYGEEIHIPDKTFNKGQVYGALIFGLGWAITGACPGPLFAQIGAGYSVVIVTFISAVAGTWVYGRFREKLPH